MNPIESRPEESKLSSDSLPKLHPEKVRKSPVPLLALSKLDQPTIDSQPVRPRFHRFSKEKRERSYESAVSSLQTDAGELFPTMFPSAASQAMQIKLSRGERPFGHCSDESKSKSRSPRGVLNLSSSPSKAILTPSVSPRPHSNSPSPRGGAEKKVLKRPAEGFSTEIKRHSAGPTAKKTLLPEESLLVGAQEELIDSQQLVLKAIKASITGDVQQFDLLETESEVVKYDKELTAHLIASCNKYKVEVSCNLNDSIYAFCTSEAVAYFEKLAINSKTLQKEVEAFSTRLFCAIRHPKILLGQSMACFEELRAETWRFFKLQQYRTVWSTTLYTTLSRISEATDIVEVLNTLELIAGKNKHEGVLREAAKQFLGSPRTCQISTLPSAKKAIMGKLLVSCFGSFYEDISDVLKGLYLWSHDSEQKALQEKLREYISSIITKLKAMASFPRYTHRLVENASKCKSSMRTIKLADIVRSLMPDATILMDKITINGNSIYSSSALAHPGALLPANESSLPDLSKAVLSEDSASIVVEEQERAQRAFFRHLVKSIFEACGKKCDLTIIKHLVNQFFSLVQREEEGGDFSNYGAGKNVLKPQFTGDLPFVGVLRLMTINCFLRVHTYLQLLFPKLFVKSISSDKMGCYSVKYPQGTICDINIDGSGNYEVFQRKKASIVHYRDQAAKPLAMLDLCWGSAFIETGSLSELSISAWKVCDMSHWVEFVDIWAEPIAAFDPSLIPEGYTYEACRLQQRLGKLS